MKFCVLCAGNEVLSGHSCITVFCSLLAPSIQGPQRSLLNEKKLMSVSLYLFITDGETEAQLAAKLGIQPSGPAPKFCILTTRPFFCPVKHQLEKRLPNVIGATLWTLQNLFSPGRELCIQTDFVSVIYWGVSDMSRFLLSSHWGFERGFASSWDFHTSIFMNVIRKQLWSLLIIICILAAPSMC